MRPADGLRPLLALFALALALRWLFVAWAPGVPGADGFFYDQYARLMARGAGYVNLDGSPGIRWMPGWTAVLAALYAAFGVHPKLGMFANGVFDAGTAVLVAMLGTRLVDARVGRFAGLAYALWPGMVFYSATTFSEPLANLLLASVFVCAASLRASDERRLAWAAAIGLSLGAAAWVKAEPLVLAPVLALFLWRVRRDERDFVRSLVVTGLVAAVVIAPWVVRNYVVFDRFLPTSASGGIGLQIANHPGATGGQDFLANRRFQAEFQGDTSAETSLRRHDAGLRDAWAFARKHPGEQLAIVANKFRITYGGDAQAVRTVRGSGPPERWHISPGAWRGLSALANGWWFLALALAAGGAWRLRGAEPGTALLVLGPVVTWWALHVPFLGGERYHVPEIPSYAVLVGIFLAGATGPGLPYPRAAEPSERDRACPGETP